MYIRIYQAFKMISLIMSSTQGKWRGIMHQVYNSHEWLTPIHPGEKTWCVHEALPDPEDKGQKEPLVSGSPAHKALYNLALDDGLLNNFLHYLNLR